MVQALPSAAGVAVEGVEVVVAVAAAVVVVVEGAAVVAEVVAVALVGADEGAEFDQKIKEVK